MQCREFSVMAGLRILTGKKHRQIKLQRLEKVEYGRLGYWHIKSIIYKRFLN